MNDEFTYKEKVYFEPWMKRGAKVITMMGKGTILYVRKNAGEVLNINVRVWHNEYQYQDYTCAAWGVKLQ